MKKSIVFFLSLTITVTLYSQEADSLNTAKTPNFRSLGFNLSNICGMGVSYRLPISNVSRLRLTGGILVLQEKNQYAIGIVLENDLSKSTNFRVHVGPAGGLYGDSQGTGAFVFGLDMGFEIPITGSTISKNISAGGDIIYPAYYGRSKTVTIGASIFIYYNF
jgi:hypothetical protein